MGLFSNDMLQLAIAVLVVMAGSAVCSCSETALLSTSLIKVRQLAQTRQRSALALLAIREKVSRPIASIVVLNNVFNIVGSIAIGRLASVLLGDAWLGIFSGLLTFLIIVFGEVVPKTLGERYAEPISLAISLPLTGLTWALTPVVMLLELVTAPLVKGVQRPTTNEAEIQLLARIGYQEGLIEDDEAAMIQRIFRLNDLTAADLMTPRVALTYLRGARPLGEVKAKVIGSQHSRIVVVEDSIDKVIGVALKAELLIALIEGKESSTIAELARPVQFVPDTQRADILLKSFREVREHLMVVIDEYGGVSGVVTLEDVVEELTGEIVDETDRNVDLQALARLRGKRLLRDRGFDTQRDPR